MMLRSTTRDEFVAHLTDLKEDRFAKRFVSKCDMIKAWDRCTGLWDNNALAGAIVVTISKRKPAVANLQLLHTFFAHRGKGVATKLCDHGLNYAFINDAEYFRVSSELDSVKFYEKFGFKMLCSQKTAQLAMFQLHSPKIQENDMEINPFILKELHRKGKGGCVEIF